MGEAHGERVQSWLQAKKAGWYTVLADPQLRRRLTPSFRLGCKRILVSDEYYPTLSRPGVEVVTDGIESVRERSIVARDGTEREIDNWMQKAS